MSKQKAFFHVIAGLFILALASRAMTSDKVTFSLSPTSLEFHAEGRK
jgi:hypothetical protein